jgi:transcriptional regulator GlxA family with amidase domain
MSGSYLTAKHGNLLPQAKLNPDLVREIRRRAKWKADRIAELNAKYSVQAMADDLGLSRRTLERVLAFETWRHVA